MLHHGNINSYSDPSLLNEEIAQRGEAGVHGLQQDAGTDPGRLGAFLAPLRVANRSLFEIAETRQGW